MYTVYLDDLETVEEVWYTYVIYFNDRTSKKKHNSGPLWPHASRKYTCHAHLQTVGGVWDAAVYQQTHLTARPTDQRSAESRISSRISLVGGIIKFHQ